MNVDKYIVVGQYNCQNSKASPVFAEVVDCLSILGDVNVFDMPVAKSFGDSIEKNDRICVHHYACPYGEVSNAVKRIKDIVIDIVHIGAKECYLDYGVDSVYLPIIRSLRNALGTYGIKVYYLNREMPFSGICNLFNDIRYWIVERKIRTKEAEKLMEVESRGLNGTVISYDMYTFYEKKRIARNRIHRLRRFK